jgi:hypothetical protein
MKYFIFCAVGIAVFAVVAVLVAGAIRLIKEIIKTK